MKEKKVEPAYPGSEEDFPTVTGMMCHSCIANIKDFSSHKPKYTKAFVQEIMDRSKAASLIPNLEQRQSQSTSLGKVLSDNAGICADNFLTLFSYMDSVFDESKLPSMKKMAGGAYYDTARKNWSDATTMNSMMITFTDTYNAELTAAGMPSAFPQKCIDDSAAFSTAFEVYEDYKGIAEQQRQDKVKANNGVYKSLTGIMKDGKFIYRNDEALRKQFTFSVVLSKVTKNTRTGFTIKVNASGEGETVSTSELRLEGEPQPFTANDKGIITAKVPEGIYKGTITAPGYLPLAVTYISDKGVTHREEVTLTLAAATAG